MTFFMSNSVSDDLQLFAQEIKSLLSPNTLQNLARDVGFGVLPHRHQPKIFELSPKRKFHSFIVVHRSSVRFSFMGRMYFLT